ncbi:hypothetical protein D3C85_1242940 [compost metagenome]
MAVSRHLLRQAAEQSVAGNAFEQTLFRSFPGRSTQSRTQACADQEADQQHQDQRQELFGRQPLRKDFGEGPHQLPEGFHALEQHQNGQVDRDDDQQTSDHSFGEIPKYLFHVHYPRRRTGPREPTSAD